MDTSKRMDEEKLLVATKTIAFLKEANEKQTVELTNANNELTIQDVDKRKRAEELVIANKEMAFQDKEKEKRADELLIANNELAFQNEEKETRSAELGIANIELVFQNKEKEKRASELIIANEELAFQNEEKEKRASELIIANKELAFQNEEKEKRAAELIIANKELAFQNEEKEKRAAELIIANNELVFQNQEKEKRATELTNANRELKKSHENNRKLYAQLEQKVIDRTIQLESLNKELVFQNEEKEKRAAELIIANKELIFQNGEKEKRAAELIIANNDLESFSYSVSHDLRAPIRAINGYTKILIEDYSEKLDVDGIKVLQSISNNSNKMGELIDDLLAFSKLGRKQVIVSKINMTDLVNLVISELLFEDGENIPVFNIEMLPPAKGDRSLIKQVWINLIANAIKYSQYRSTTCIEIGAYQKDVHIVYYIKDNGAGFDMQYYDKLFGVFQRLHSSLEFTGTGIGLAIVHKIVNRHHGTVWAESKLNE